MAFTQAALLNSGTSIPLLGLGTWQSPKGEVAAAVKAAVELGYRHIDCAQAYSNEKEIGEALQELFAAGTVKREDLWITSKLWNEDHDNVEAACDVTLANLKVDYLDLYLIHWPVTLVKGATSNTWPPGDDGFLPFQIRNVWPGMEHLKCRGKVRAIGVSNFSVKKLENLLSFAEIPPAVNQVEANPSWRQGKLRSFMHANGIHLSAYSPLGSGGTKGITVKVLEHPVIKKIADSTGKTPAQVALRWAVQTGYSVLPKSTNVGRLKENAAIFDWSLAAEDYEQLNHIEETRVVSGSFWVGQASSEYKSVEDLWDGEV